MFSRRGSFAERPYYTSNQLERICTDALQSIGLLPSLPEAIRIDRFVEKYFKLSISYEELPNSILGFTRFSQLGVTEIGVTTAFDYMNNGVVAERRLRTTLAHEAGHGLLHAHLFALGEKPLGLFGAESDAKPEIMCRDIEGLSTRRPTYDGKWWEYQANKAIGALLMPKRLVYAAAAQFCTKQGLLSELVLMESHRESAACELANVFDVNPVVARIRLGEVFPAEMRNQLTL